MDSPISRGARLAYACAFVSWVGCSTDSDRADQGWRVEASTTGAAASAVYGDDTARDDNWGYDTYFQDTVVSVGGCTGTLITPLLVLTAAHCNTDTTTIVHIGPHKAGDPATPGNQWRDSIQIVSVESMSDGSSSDSDLQLVTLARPVMTMAFSGRPFEWTGWNFEYADSVPPKPIYTFNDPTSEFGIAGWSRFSGPIDCTTDPTDPGPTDAEHEFWRQRAEPLGQNAFHLTYDSSTIRWHNSNSNKASVGDSGGPLYKKSPDLSRRVIGVASRIDCELLADFTYARTVLYTDVTHGLPSAWIAQHADDSVNRTADWLTRHGKGQNYWKGEVDYIGPCTTAGGAGTVDDRGVPPANQDLDCDHWYDIHDDCPRDYNPGQEEDAAGKGLACNTRLSLDDFDPMNPAPTHAEIPLGTCTSDSPECPIGICYFTEVTGQFWQKVSIDGGPRYIDPAYLGSYARIDADGSEYKVVLDIKPDLAADEWYTPPTVKAECLSLRDIQSIPAPEQCSLYTGMIQGGPPLSGTVSMLPGTDSFNLISGLVGNVGFPGTGALSTVRVTNGSTANTLNQSRASNAGRRGFTAETFSIACPGWTRKLTRANVKVSASGAPVTTVLVDGETAGTSRCFLTGFNGPWGGYSRSSAKPSARIHRNPVTNSILMTVSPSGIATNSQAVEAYATCIDLSP